MSLLYKVKYIILKAFLSFCMFYIKLVIELELLDNRHQLNQEIIKPPFYIQNKLYYYEGVFIFCIVVQNQQHKLA